MSDHIVESLPPIAVRDRKRNLRGQRPTSDAGDAATTRPDGADSEASVRSWPKRVFASLRSDTRRAEVAEERLGQQLTDIAPGWHALHSVHIELRNTTIDHLVVGPTGVFAVTAKQHEGAKVSAVGDSITVNGFHKAYVAASRFEAVLVSQLLSAAMGYDVPVTGIVVLVDTAHETFKAQPSDGVVHVTTARGVRRWLKRQPIRFSPEAVDELFDKASRATTWADNPAMAPHL